MSDKTPSVEQVGDEWEDYLQQPPTRPVPADDRPNPSTENAMNLDDVKNGLKRLLPVLKTIAAITPTPLDNIAVQFLEALLADDVKLAAAVANVKS